ncbi:MAG: MltA domain-containing protein, partial [Methylobacteriaceae bacterium]|nr:MltA domain-containing protein [Methylobacteriaceae bacterium]
MMSALACLLGSGVSGCTPGLPEGQAVSFASLAGWNDDDHGAVRSLFRRFCASHPDAPVSDALKAQHQALVALCPAAGEADSPSARLFFEDHFVPYEVRGTPERAGRGFLTGYYEPEFAGSLEPTADFTAPLLSLPAGYVPPPGNPPAPGFPARRRVIDAGGTEQLQPLPPRAEIESGALAGLTRPLVYLKEPGQAFIIHVQGSARIRLVDGAILRVAFAGRNGYPYTSIGRILLERGEIAKGGLTLKRLLDWLAAHPDQARELMNRNESFIFFRVNGDVGDDDGPTGAAGIPLLAERSL